MGGFQHLLLALVLVLTVGGIVISTGNAGQGLSIQVKHERSGVFLLCKGSQDDSPLNWSKGSRDLGAGDGNRLAVGSAADDPRGLYRCHSKQGDVSLQLYFRMCQYCVQLSLAPVLGVVVADLIATAVLVGTVWCLAAQEPSRLSRASDKQALLAHDQLYQPLGERNNGQYSHIGVAKARRR